MEDNLNTYTKDSVVKWYDRLSELIPVEKIVFENYRDLLQNGTVLDIGIGGGRTTGYLMGRCKSYTGIDYSGKFVSLVKNKFPGGDFRTMDARDLSEFKSQSFDFVNFSFNGIDYVDLKGREKIFSEVARVLKPGGIFFFSSHNKAHSSFNVYPWLDKNNALFTNLKTFLKLIPFLARKLRNKKQEVFSAGYSIINDSAHNYRLFTFYTTPGFLRSQLSAEKLDAARFYTKSGKHAPDEELDDWIFGTAIRS